MIADRRRIVGGVPTIAYPDCVAVGSTARWCCSGTIVAPNVVVTAAHCARDGCCDRVLVGGDVTSAGAVIVGVQEAHTHPSYRSGSRFNDLCVLLLDRHLAVAPRLLAGAHTLDSAISVRLAGFGTIDERGRKGYGTCRTVDVPLASADPRFGADPATEFVAGQPFLDRDSCTGDSGGPAYVEVDGAWQLVGAVSRATAGVERTCGDGGVYTLIPAFADWIKNVPGGAWK